MALATVTDLEALLDLDFTASDVVRAQLLLDLVSGEVESFCDVAFQQRTDTYQLSGTWSHRLVLPRPPVTAVASALLDGDAITDYRVIRNVLARNPGSHWGGPDRIVAVTYTHGLTAIPDVVRGVTLRAAARTWANPEQRESIQLESGYQTRFTAQREDKGMTFLTTGDMRTLINNDYRRTAA